MAKMQEFKCPCCGGSIEFDSSVQKMKCPFCDTEFDVGTLSEYAQTVEEEQSEDMSWSDEPAVSGRTGRVRGQCHLVRDALFPKVTVYGKKRLYTVTFFYYAKEMCP